ncbi:hypothetical protein GALL_478930 [mine drainage metagenome]|uniref:Uncharacterized protein n=1 Tax=mine drainage metagenome TaxID=410659 RepID=A0A1J5PRX0_9ZZZZ
MQAGLEKTIGKTGGNVSQVQCGSARAAQADGTRHEVCQHAQIGVKVIALAERETRGQQAILETDAFGHPDAAVVHEGTTPLGGRKQVVAAGVVNDRLLDFALVGQGNADAVNRQTVDEVGGAVQRVDDPDKFGVLCAVGAA